jgi:hypothetical protein
MASKIKVIDAFYALVIGSTSYFITTSNLENVHLSKKYSIESENPSLTRKKVYFHLFIKGTIYGTLWPVSIPILTIDLYRNKFDRHLILGKFYGL